MKKLVCIVCPNSCELEINETEGGLSVSGNKCKRGVTFATDEMTAPKRTISSVVKTAFTAVPVLPVRVSAEIPKERIFDVMREINHVTVEKRLKRGDVVIQNVLSLGVDVIAASGILAELPEEEKEKTKEENKKEKKTEKRKSKKTAPAKKTK